MAAFPEEGILKFAALPDDGFTQNVVSPHSRITASADESAAILPEAASSYAFSSDFTACSLSEPLLASSPLVPSR